MKIILNDLFDFKHYFIFFIVDEHLAVPFVKLASIESCVGLM